MSCLKKWAFNTKNAFCGFSQIQNGCRLKNKKRKTLFIMKFPTALFSECYESIKSFFPIWSTVMLSELRSVPVCGNVNRIHGVISFWDYFVDLVDMLEVFGGFFMVQWRKNIAKRTQSRALWNSCYNVA